MRITFVLPDVTPLPNGGVKIVYEYANRLTARGHTVAVVHPRNWVQMRGIVQFIKARLWPLSIYVRYGGAAPWMRVERGVKQLLPPDLRPQFLPDADVIFATFFRTAPPVFELPIQKGRKYFLIQSYETWAGSVDDVDYTWRLPMYRVVISKALLHIAESLNLPGKTAHIPPGLDLIGMEATRNLVDRDHRIAMLYHSSPLKGSMDGIRALEAVRQTMPSLQAVLFGTEFRANVIPEWIHYVQLPDRIALCALYNSAAIFLQPSHLEGWGLTSTEAMACGCALVTTDNGGSRDFAIHEETALVVPVGDDAAMAASISRLLQDSDLLLRLASAGERHALSYTWERALDAIEAVMADKL